MQIDASDAIDSFVSVEHGICDNFIYEPKINEFKIYFNFILLVLINKYYFFSRWEMWQLNSFKTWDLLGIRKKKNSQ